METQTDYETSPTLAVFDSPEQAAAAIQALHALRVDISCINHLRLDPGTYQLEDPSWLDEVQGLLRGAGWGILLGAAVGLDVAAIHVSQMGGSLTLLPAFAIAGAVAGVLLGALFGAIKQAHFDDDVADWIDIPSDRPTELVAVYCGGPAPRIRQALLRAGARGILDPTMPEADRVMRLASVRTA